MTSSPELHFNKHNKKLFEERILSVGEIFILNYCEEIELVNLTTNNAQVISTSVFLYSNLRDIVFNLGYLYQQFLIFDSRQ